MLLAALLVLPAGADLNQAQRYLEQHHYAQGWREALRCRSEDPERAELLHIWGLHHDLREPEARRRFQLLKPSSRHGRLYFLVRDQVLHQGEDRPERLRDLQQLLRLSSTPAEQLEAHLKLYVATSFPEDEKHWMAAARLAPQVPSNDPLLGQLHLTHLSLLKNRSRLDEAWLDLAQLQRSLKNAPEGAAQVQLARSQLLEGLGRTSEAAEARWSAVEQAQDELYRLKILRSLAERRFDLGPQRATRALQMLDRHRPSEPLRRAYALQIRSLILLDSGQGQSAWEREVAWLSQRPEPRLRLLALSERARTQALRGKKDGLELLEQALQLSSTLPAVPGILYRECHPARLSQHVAIFSLAQSRFEAAGRRAQQALEAADEGDFEVRNVAHLTLLQLYSRTAQIEAARNVLRQLFKEAESHSSPAQRVTIYVSVFNLMLLIDLHAVKLFALGSSRMDPDTPSGWLFEELRQDDELMQAVFRALRAWRELARTPATRGSALLYEGLVLACLDRPLEAIDTYTRALEAAEGVAFLQANIGLMLASELVGQGRQVEALGVLQRAHQRAQEAGPVAQPSRYQIALMGLLMQLNRSEEALQLPALADDHPDARLDQFLRARARSDKARLRSILEASPSAPLRDEVRFELSRLEPDQGWLEAVEGRQPDSWLRRIRLLRQQGRSQQAHALCLEALEQLRQRLQRLPQATQTRAAASPTVHALLDEGLQLCLELQRPEQASQLLQQFGNPNPAGGATSPELERLRAELTGLEQHPGSISGEQLADTRARFLAELNEVRRRHPESERVLAAQGAELLELQPQLPEDALLVQYFLAPEGLYLQALTRQRQVLRRVRVERSRLVQLIQRWRQALQQPQPLSAQALEANHQLYSLLLAPLRDLRQPDQQLWLLPGGELWSLPLETLQDEQGQFLTQSTSVAYLGPADLLQLNRPIQRRPGPWLALGQQQLPATLRELELLGNAFERPGDLSWHQLQQRAPELQVLHLATHSQARPDRPNQSSLQLGQQNIPLQQLYELRLAPQSLVVLNSCGGAQSQLQVERDPLSLASGFRSAGASSVVAALWPIDDEASAEFFPAMYQALQQGRSRAQSLQMARLRMLQSPTYSHPYYWGGYTLLGDPR